MQPWETKANNLIQAMAFDAYRKAGNKPGRKHRTYTLPALADELVKCLGTGDEHKAKDISIRLAYSPEMIND